MDPDRIADLVRASSDAVARLHAAAGGHTLGVCAFSLGPAPRGGDPRWEILPPTSQDISALETMDALSVFSRLRDALGQVLPDAWGHHLHMDLRVGRRESGHAIDMRDHNKETVHETGLDAAGLAALLVDVRAVLDAIGAIPAPQKEGVSFWAVTIADGYFGGSTWGVESSDPQDAIAIGVGLGAINSMIRDPAPPEKALERVRVRRIQRMEHPDPMDAVPSITGRMLARLVSAQARRGATAPVPGPS